MLTQDHKKPLDDLFQLATTVEAAEKESFTQAEDSSVSSHTCSDFARNFVVLLLIF